MTERKPRDNDAEREKQHIAEYWAEKSGFRKMNNLIYKNRNSYLQMQTDRRLQSWTYGYNNVFRSLHVLRKCILLIYINIIRISRTRVHF